MQPFVRRVALPILFLAIFVACPFRGQAQNLDELVDSARAAQSADNYSDAAAIYRRATVLAPNIPELWANRGMMEYLAGQFDPSIASLKHALQLNPALFVPMLFLGKAYVQTGKPALAIPYLTHAHALQPKDPEVLLSLAKANSDLKRQRQAATLYADAVHIAPDNAEAWYGLGVSSLGVITLDGSDLAASQAQSPWARALYADELLTQGRPVEASDTYKAALASASPAEKAMLGRMLEWMQAHPDLFPVPANSAEALQHLSAQLDAEPGQLTLPPCAPVDDKRKTAAKPTAAAGSPLQAAACAYWAGDYDRSAAQAAQVQQQSPHNAEALYWSIKSNERLAVAALARFEELAPQSAKDYAMVGDLYRYQRQMDSALAEYKKALAIDAHDPSALIGAVVVSLSLNKLDDAISFDQAALADRPDDPQLNLLMAEILVQKNQFDQVKVYLAKCADAPPELQTRIHLLLGRVDVEDGDNADAIKQFELALPSDEDGSIHYQLSRLYRKTGDLAAAQQAEAGAKALIKKRDASAVIAVREATGTNQ
jgi:tetratricopeptide (TPR) repeat protein